MRTATKYFKVSIKPFQRLGGVRGGSPEKALKKKRKVNGNLTRRPPARLIALYKVFKVSLKPFQRLVGFGATPREKNVNFLQIQHGGVLTSERMFTKIGEKGNLLTWRYGLCLGRKKRY